jgi:hypothetical protein
MEEVEDAVYKLLGNRTIDQITAEDKLVLVIIPPHFMLFL